MTDYSAKVISLTPITDAMLASSSEAESDYPAWNQATAYAVDAMCIRTETHRIYRRVVAGTTATAPELDSINWLDVAPTNRWAMFDAVVGTSTVATGSISLVIQPGSVSGLSLLEVFGSAVSIVMKDEPGGTVVYSKTVDIDSSEITDVYDWFFQPIVRDANISITDLPFHFSECEISITLTGSGGVSVGVCAVGEVIGIGKTEAGPTSGITSFSGIERNTFGVYSIVKRKFAKRMTLKVMIDHSDYNRVSRALAALDAVFSVWIATERPGYDPLTIYGKYKDFSIEVPYQNYHFCSIEIEGVI